MQEPLITSSGCSSGRARAFALVVVSTLLWLTSSAWSAASAQEEPIASEARVGFGCNGDAGYVIFTVSNPNGYDRSYELQLIDDDSREQIVQTPARNVTVGPYETQLVFIDGLYNYAELKPRVFADGQLLDDRALVYEFNLYCREDSFAPRSQCSDDGRGEIFTYSALAEGFEVDIAGLDTMYAPPTPPGNKTQLAGGLDDGIYRISARSRGQEIYIGDLVVECDFDVQARPLCVNLQRFVEVSLQSEFFSGSRSVGMTSDDPGFVGQNKLVQLDAGETTLARFSNQAADPSKIVVTVDNRPVQIDVTLDFACEQVEEPVVEIDKLCLDRVDGAVAALDVVVQSEQAGVLGVARVDDTAVDDTAGLMEATSVVVAAGERASVILGFGRDGEPQLVAGNSYDLVWSWNGVSGGHVSVEAPFCDAPPYAEVQLAAGCLAGRGRIDVFVANELGSSSDFVARLNRVGLPVRSIRLALGESGTMTWTGRADGGYLVTVERDGDLISTGEVVVDCTPLPDSEVTVTESCLFGRGRFDVLLYNDSGPLDPNNGVREYVVIVGSVVRKVKVTATEGPAKVIVTGRPTDKPTLVTVERAGVGNIYTETFEIDC